MLGSPKIDGGSDLARTKFSVNLDAANIAPPINSRLTGSGLAYFSLGNLGNVGLHHSGLKTATIAGY